MTLQHRFENSPLGQAAISGVVCLILLTGVVWNLPPSEAKRVMTPTLQPIAAVAGLDQVWQMYAPEPIRQLETVEVHVTLADGADRIWTIHRGDLILGPFAWYRWQKLKEQAVREPGIRAGIARWVVGQLTRPGERVDRVRMTLRTVSLPPPGRNETPQVHLTNLYDESFAATK